jgi:uncharacterized protein (DUF1499 family)
LAKTPFATLAFLMTQDLFNPFSAPAACLAAALALSLAGCAIAPASPDSTAPACALPTNCMDSLGAGGLGPLAYTGSPEQALSALQATLATFAEATVLRSDARGVDAVFITPAGFRDQVEFRIDTAAKRINFRSRSTFGLFDFGKNRSRMQAFATRFDEMKGR